MLAAFFTPVLLCLACIMLKGMARGKFGVVGEAIGGLVALGCLVAFLVTAWPLVLLVLGVVAFLVIMAAGGKGNPQ